MGYVRKCEYCGYVVNSEGWKNVRPYKKYRMCLCDECVDKANGQWMPNSGLDTYPAQRIYLNSYK